MKKSSLIFSSILLILTSCGKQTTETKPIRKDVTETVFASGVLVADASYSLTAQVSGYIAELHFTEGDFVEKGTLLAVIENKESPINTQSAEELLSIAESNAAKTAPQLLQAQTNIDINRQKMQQDALLEQRYKRLLDNNSIAKIDYENALLSYKTSKSNFESSIENYKKLERDARQQVVSNRASKQIYTVAQGKNQIRALISGKVYKKKKQLGDYVRQGDVIAEIGDAKQIYAQVNIDESNISKINIGQKAIVQLNVNKGKVYYGIVKEINPSFDEGTQSFVCKIYFTDSLDFTIINTQLQCNITVGIKKNALLIPRNYIDFGGMVRIKGQKEKTKVTTDFVSGDWVHVLSGIDENTVLITENIAANNVKTSQAGSQMK